MALDILHNYWGPYTHTEVENALKAYLSGLEDRINRAIQSGGVGLTDLSEEVQALLNKANTALQSETDPTVPNWAKQSNKPTYNVSEIIYSSNRPLSSKLDEMTAEILAAGATDSEMSDSSKKPVQNNVVKAYVDAAVLTLQNALNALMNGQSVTDAIDTFNEVKAFLDGIDTDDPTLANQLLALNNAISALQTSLAAKANAADVYSKSDVDTKVANAGKVKSVSVNNGTHEQPDAQGNVNLTVDAGADTDIVGISVPNPYDGTVIFTKRNGDTVTVNLNHTHPQYQPLLTAGANITIVTNQQTGDLEISASGGSGGSQVQADWNEDNSTSAAYIKNKPTIPTVPTNVSSFTNDANYLKFQLLANEAAYEALATKDNGTLYLIPES